MKFIATAIICLAISTAYGQKNGINFQNKLSWTEVKDKAKKEHKYIFLDCYTTWCGPCKVMAKEMFPQPEVASFFNEKFISVAVQFDKTKQDDADTKRWLKEVKRIEDEAKVDAYPTYLFYNPDGQLVHTIIGGSPDAKTFLAKVKQALDPKMQLRTLRKQYEEGNRSVDFLHTFADALLQGWDGQANEVINQYLATQQNLLTKENAEYIMRATEKSTDPGFDVLVNKAEEYDKLTQPGLSRDIIGRIAFDEIVLPMVRVNGVKESHGGMYMYKGEIIKNVKWDDAYLKIRAKYPALADEIILKSKVTYYRSTEDWSNYTEQADVYVKRFGSDNNNQVMTYANDLMLFAADTACLSKAADWSKQVLNAYNGPNKSWYTQVYASLLYKLGDKAKAELIVENAIAELGDKAYGLKETQEKIKSGKL